MTTETKRATAKAAGATRHTWAGAPRKARDIIHFHALITAEQREKLLRLGGSQWLREQIDAAEEGKP